MERIAAERSTSPHADQSGTSSEQEWWQARSDVVGLVALAIAIAIAAIAAAVRGWVPLSDAALIELRVRDVPRHLPLVGAWSRFGWNHPGPAQFYYLSPFYWLSGRHSWGLLTGSLALHLIFLTAGWWMVRQLDRTAGALVLLGGTAILLTSPSTSLLSPWNPYVMIVGGLALCCAAWSFAERQTSGAVLLLPIGSFLVQAHLGAAALVAAVVATAACLVVTRRDRPAPRSALLAGALLAFLMWVPPLAQQIFGHPGNLAAIVTERGSDATLGVLTALKVASDALQPWPGVLNPATVGDPLLHGDRWRFPLWGILFLIAIVHVVRRRNWLLVRGAAVAASAFLGTVLGIALLRGTAFSYLAIALRGATVLIMAIVITSVLSEVFRVGDRLSIPAISAVVVLMAAAIAVAQIGAENPLAGDGAMIDRFTEVVVKDGLPHQLEVQSLVPNPESMSAAPGLLLSLERAGFRASAPTLGSSLVGSWRADQNSDYVVKIIPADLERTFIEDGWQVLARDGLVLVGRPI